MAATSSPREQLCTAIVNSVQRIARKHPGGMDMRDVCGAIGVAAGTIVGAGIPAGLPEADLISGEIIGIAFAQGVASVRKRAAS